MNKTDWQGFFDHFGEDTAITIEWGNGEDHKYISINELYGFFKARLMNEMRPAPLVVSPSFSTRGGVPIAGSHPVCSPNKEPFDCDLTKETKPPFPDHDGYYPCGCQFQCLCYSR